MYVCYSTLLHLPPLRFHCVRGCWDRTQDCCDSGIDSQMLHATTRLDLIYIRLDLIHIFFITSWCFYSQLKIRMHMKFWRSYTNRNREDNTRIQTSNQYDNLGTSLSDEAASMTERSPQLPTASRTEPKFLSSLMGVKELKTTQAWGRPCSIKCLFQNIKSSPFLLPFS